MTPRKPCLILGIDPGLNGALAFIRPPNVAEGRKRELVAVYDMPTTPSTKAHTAREVDLYALGSIIEIYAKETRMAIIEEVCARPNEGRTTVFNFGFATGAVCQAVSSCMIPVQRTNPAAWKSIMGCNADKRSSVFKANEYFPDAAAEHWPLKKHHGRAEAVLLGIFGERLLPLLGG